MFEEFGGQGMVRGELLKHLGVGARPRLAPLHDRQSKLVEQHRPQLQGRCDRKGVAGECVNLPLERLQAARVVHRQGGQPGGIDADAAKLHACEHRCQRQLDIVKQFGHAVGRQPRRQPGGEVVHQPAVHRRRPGVAGVVDRRRGCGVIDRHAVPDRRLGEAKVPLACLQEIGRQQGVESHPCKADAASAEGDILPREVVTVLGHRGIGEQTTELHVLCHLVAAEPPGLAAGGEADPAGRLEDRSARGPRHADRDRGGVSEPGDGGSNRRPSRLLDRHRSHSGLRRLGRAIFHVKQRAGSGSLRPRGRGRFAPCCLTGRVLHDPAKQAAKPKLAEQVGQRLGIGEMCHPRLPGNHQRHVPHQSDQFTTRPCGSAVGQ